MILFPSVDCRAVRASLSRMMSSRDLASARSQSAGLVSVMPSSGGLAIRSAMAAKRPRPGSQSGSASACRAPARSPRARVGSGAAAPGLFFDPPPPGPAPPRGFPAPPPLAVPAPRSLDLAGLGHGPGRPPELGHALDALVGSPAGQLALQPRVELGVLDLQLREKRPAR